jgi:hypothetical protein
MLELLQRAKDRNLVFFDLLNAGLIQDGYPDQSSIETVPAKLDIMIKNKAERAASIFRSTQDDLVALGQLPVEWSMPEYDPKAKVLTASEFITAAENLAMKKSDSSDYSEFVDKIKQKYGEVLSEDEIAKYLILHELDQHLAIGSDIDDMLILIPEYQEALSQVSEGVSVTA